MSSLHIYPIKSCRGLDLKSVRLDALGPLYDRRFMVVDEEGRFLTQRELPRMALIEPRLGPLALQVQAPGMPVLKVAVPPRDAPSLEVQVWRDRGPLPDAGGHAAAWLSEFLGRPCRLVHIPDDAGRTVDPRYAPRPARVGFADGYPLLLLSEASLEDLNARLAQKLPMNRFRPNLVVTGTEPFAEDGWKRIRVGEVVLDVVKPCARCTITTVDQVRGIAGKEPLATLATFRARDNEVLFGQNCIHDGPGSIRIGDPVEVLETA